MAHCGWLFFKTDGLSKQRLDAAAEGIIRDSNYNVGGVLLVIILYGELWMIWKNEIETIRVKIMDVIGSDGP